MIRIGRLLATAATSVILLLGAVIALEALGLLFWKESPQSEPVVANVHFREVPEETAPARLLKQLEEQELAEAKAKEERAAQAKAEAARAAEERRAPEETAKAELALQEAERQAAAAEAEARKLAEARRLEAEQAERKKMAALVPPPVTDAPSQAEAEPAPVKLAPAAGPESSKRIVHVTQARRERTRVVRRLAVHRATPRCPFLAWLETVMGPPPA
jgi:uncharacterized protein YfaS (alpha-2-macroglobulin family)